MPSRQVPAESRGRKELEPKEYVFCIIIHGSLKYKAYNDNYAGFICLYA